MSLLRFLMLVALVVWLGALIFFPVVAQVSFRVLPSPHLAGLVVRDSLIALHWMGIGSGIAFLACSVIENRIARGRFATLRGTHWLIAAMLALTSISQFKIIPQMDALRMQAGEISQLASSDPVRQRFDSLHAESTRIEGAVLVLGLIVLYLTTKRIAAARA